MFILISNKTEVACSMRQGEIERIDEYRWRIPKSYKTGMRVDGVVYADEKMMETIRSDRSLEQVANVATLPGIVKSSLAMPDIHWGYGFPIGGVAATDIDAGGVISPGGVGFDINCGVRLMKTSLCEDEVKPKIRDLVYALYNDIPAGVGSKGDIRISEKEERRLLVDGARWVVSHGYGEPSDISTEEDGAIKGADPDKVSARSYERGEEPVRHAPVRVIIFEIQVIDEV